MAKPWDLTHDPYARPLGCNKRYGYSGRDLHKRAGTTVCGRCKASVRHAERERRRGQTIPRPLFPCGTHAAAKRHRTRNETLDFACRVAEANYAAQNKVRKTREHNAV